MEWAEFSVISSGVEGVEGGEGGEGGEGESYRAFVHAGPAFFSTGLGRRCGGPRDLGFPLLCVGRKRDGNGLANWGPVRSIR